MIQFLRHLIVDDFLLKLFSLVLALLFWLTVSFAIQQKEVLPAPVSTSTTEVHTFTNISVLVLSAAGDVRSLKISPGQVDVIVEGEARTLRSMQGKDIRAIVDLTGFEPAHPRKRVEVSLPPGVTFLGVRPDEVQMIVPPKTPAR